MTRIGRGTAAVVLVAALAARASAGGPSAAEIGRLRRQAADLAASELRAHWYPHALDEAHGGFHQTFARDWSPLPDDDRFLVYQARMTWTAAAFAAHAPAHRDEFAGYARRGIAFLDRVMRDREQGGFHWVLDVDGRVSPRLGDEKHVYGTAFVVYAASKAYEATHDERALAVARDAFDWLEAHAHDPQHGGYFEALRRDGTPIVDWEHTPNGRRQDRLNVYYGFKSMNSHIHLLEALAELTRVDRRPIVRQRLGETLALVRDRIAVEPGALNLYLTPDWRAAPAHDSFGHDVETAFLLLEAADALGTPDDGRTARMARRLVDHALAWGWDDEHGGFYDKGEVFNGQAFARNKVWWTQAEGLNALLLMHRRHAADTDRYWAAFRKQWDFITRHQIDPRYGGWYMETTREGAPVGDDRKATPWKANYHTARALMNVETILGAMEAEAGR
jgi:mannobiose 2-epimerase